MAVNKVNFGGNTLIDLTGDTLDSAEQLLKGIIAHARDGSVITGLMEAGGGGVVTGSFTQAETFNIYSKVFSIDTGATDVQQGIVYLRDAAKSVTNGYRIICVVITPDYSYCQKATLTMNGTFVLKNGVISMTGTPYAAEFQAGHTYEWVVW